MNIQISWNNAFVYLCVGFSDNAALKEYSVSTAVVLIPQKPA